MARFGQLKLTSAGIQAQLNAQGGDPIRFTKIGIGSGKFTGDSTKLKDLVKTEFLIDIERGYVEDGQYTVSGFFTNENLQTSFAWREIGLFFEGENGDNILYCYSNAGDQYDIIPATTDERYTKTVRIVTAITNAAHVSIVQRPSNVANNLTTKEPGYVLDARQGNVLDSKIVSLINALAVEKARIDVFTTLPEGSTTGDAELADIRVDFEGNTYENAGDAVRGQAKKISDEINGIEGSIIGEPVRMPFELVYFTIEDDVIYFKSKADGSLIRQDDGASSEFCSTVIECSGSEKYELTLRHTSVLDSIIVTDNKNNVLESYYTRDNTESVYIEAFVITVPVNAKYIYLSSTKAFGFVVKRSRVKKICELIANIRQRIIVDINGNGDYTKLSEAIKEANENTEIIVKSGTYDIIEELGDDYFTSYDGSSFGISMPKDSKLKFCSGAKVVCHYRGSNDAVREFFSPINSTRGSVEYEDVVIEASNVKYCLHDEHGGEVDPYTVVFNRCNMYLDDSDNEFSYSRSCIGGGLGKYGTIEVKNSVFESVGGQVGGTVSYHTAMSMDDTVCHVNIHNNYFVGDDDTARVYSAYTGTGSQKTIATINNNSFGKAYMTDSKVESRNYLNEVRN